MLKISLSTLLIAGTVTLQSGCNSLQSSNQFARRNRTFQHAYATKVQEKDDKYLSLLRANNELSNQIRFLSQSTANNESRLKMIEQQMLKLEQSNASQSSQFAQKLEAERQLREQHNKTLMTQVSNQIADTANKLQSQQSKVLNTLSQPVASSAKEYMVKRGDTLSLIAKAFSVKVSDIKAANNLRSDMIRIGQKLIIPSK